ncbi:MAG: mechanosensitive ion channel family protein [Minisyncoccia bacterium]
MFIQDWTAVIANSFQNLWISAVHVLGQLVGALIVFLIGLIVAAGLDALVQRIINAIKLDKALASMGVEEYLARADISLNSAKFLGKIVYWFFVIVFLLAASDILGLSTLSSFLQSVVMYIPNIVVAVLIMITAVLLANVLKKIVFGAIKSSKLHSAGMISSLTWWSIFIFGFLAALYQLGIAVTIINTVVIGIVGMFALAGGLAFGLGGKDYATHLINKTREHLEK